MNWQGATGSCATLPTAVPSGAFTIDPALSSATLDASTSCGDVHVAWTSPSPPSVTPVVCIPSFVLGCNGSAAFVHRSSHAAGTVAAITVTEADEWAENPPYVGVLVAA
jgi:hypothetical protein